MKQIANPMMSIRNFYPWNKRGNKNKFYANFLGKIVFILLKIYIKPPIISEEIVL